MKQTIDKNTMDSKLRQFQEKSISLKRHTNDYEKTFDSTLSTRSKTNVYISAPVEVVTKEEVDLKNDMKKNIIKL